MHSRQRDARSPVRRRSQFPAGVFRAAGCAAGAALTPRARPARMRGPPPRQTPWRTTCFETLFSPLVMKGRQRDAVTSGESGRTSGGWSEEGNACRGRFGGNEGPLRSGRRRRYSDDARDRAEHGTERRMQVAQAVLLRFRPLVISHETGLGARFGEVPDFVRESALLRAQQQQGENNLDNGVAPQAHGTVILPDTPRDPLQKGLWAVSCR